MPHATCHTPHGTCHEPRATCHMPHATCHMHTSCILCFPDATRVPARARVGPRSYAAVKTLSQRKELYHEWQAERVQAAKQERKAARKAARVLPALQPLAVGSASFNPTAGVPVPVRQATRSCSCAASTRRWARGRRCATPSAAAPTTRAGGP
eukprot:1858375-Prymnesium_polylepis.1